MNITKLILSVAIIFAFTACSLDDWSLSKKQAVGTGVGAVAGGLAGSQIGSGSGQNWAIGAGVLLGALAGNEVGRSLDKADRAYMSRARDDALYTQVGETVSWNNPETPNSGSYTTIREGTSNYGNYCREFKQDVIIDGAKRTAYGTACKQQDGKWKIVD